MKRFAVITAVLCAALMIFSMTGCGGANESGTASAASGSAEEGTAASAKDSLTPDIVIEYGEYDAMIDLINKIVANELEDGTVVKVSGIISMDFSRPCIMEANEEGKRNGVQLKIEGDWDDPPATGTDVELIGTLKRRGVSMVLSVSPDNITVK